MLFTSRSENISLPRQISFIFLGLWFILNSYTLHSGHFEQWIGTRNWHDGHLFLPRWPTGVLVAELIAEGFRLFWELSADSYVFGAFYALLPSLGGS